MTWLLLACGSGAGAESGKSPSTPSKAAPRAAPKRVGSAAHNNVLVVVVDTLRADHLKHYGYERDTSKGLDDFAAQATRFEHAYAPSGWTSPSVASIMTGVFPSRHGVRRLGGALPKQWKTIAEALRDHGYTGVGHSFNHNITRKTRFHRGFASFESHSGRSGTYDDISEMTSRARQWIDDGSTPFFLYLQPMNVHGPYRVPRRHAKALLGRVPSSLFEFFGGFEAKIMRGQIELRREFSDERHRSLIDQYDVAVRYTFDELGKLLSHMQKRGVYDDALIVITSDHGEELFDHGGFNHGYTLHREVLNVPLYIKLPGQKTARSVKHWVSLMDVFPTVVDALGFEVPPKLDGRSLLPLLRGEELHDEQKMAHVTTWQKRCTGEALAWGRYKLVDVEESYEWPHGAVQLFDLQEDPFERENIAVQHPDLVEKYRRELSGMLETYEKGGSRAKSVLHEMDARRLKALGYAQ